MKKLTSILVIVLIANLLSCTRVVNVKSDSQKLDSTVVLDKHLRGELRNDSIELLNVFHCKSDTYQVEQIVFLDKRFHSSVKKYWIKDAEKIKNSICERCFKNQDSNPIKIKVNKLSTFVEVTFLNKQPVLFEHSFPVYLVNDSMIAFENMVQTTFYKYNLIIKKKEYQKLAFLNDTLEIVNYENDLQLWKFKNNQVVIKIPLSSALSFSMIYSRNNLGEGADCKEIMFDKINLDSLFKIYRSKVVKE